MGRVRFGESNTWCTYVVGDPANTLHPRQRQIKKPMPSSLVVAGKRRSSGVTHMPPKKQQASKPTAVRAKTPAVPRRRTPA
jgi:hypothetical protein